MAPPFSPGPLSASWYSRSNRADFPLICRALNPPDGAGAAVFRQYVRGDGYAVRYQRGRNGDGKGRDGEVDDCVIPPGSCGL